MPGPGVSVNKPGANLPTPAPSPEPDPGNPEPLPARRGDPTKDPEKGRVPPVNPPGHPEHPKQ